MQVLIIDEADRILEIGFEEDMRAIIKFLPKKGRQTALFSATQTQNVAALARLAIEHKPVYVAAQASAENSTVSTLEQGFVVCEASHRFMLLFTFLKKNLKKKARTCCMLHVLVHVHVHLLTAVHCVCTACALRVHCTHSRRFHYTRQPCAISCTLHARAHIHITYACACAKCFAPQVIVFFSSCNSVKYHAELFNFVDIPVLDLHRSWLQVVAALDDGSSPLGLPRLPCGLGTRLRTCERSLGRL